MLAHLSGFMGLTCPTQFLLSLAVWHPTSAMPDMKRSIVLCTWSTHLKAQNAEFDCSLADLEFQLNYFDVKIISILNLHL